MTWRGAGAGDCGSAREWRAQSDALRARPRAERTNVDLVPVVVADGVGELVNLIGTEKGMAKSDVVDVACTVATAA